MPETTNIFNKRNPLAVVGVILLLIVLVIGLCEALGWPFLKNLSFALYLTKLTEKCELMDHLI